jgi:plastocyanin
MRLALILLCCIVIVSTASAQGTSVSGTVTVDQHGKELPDASGAVIWLTPLDRPAEPMPAEHVYRLAQKDKHFEPHLLVIPKGAEVEFPNKDPFFHNVFSLHDGVRFDLGLYERGASKAVRFNRTGASYIFCNIHPDMSAVIMVMSTRYYTVTDAKGSYTIANVPAGEYQASIWYERAVTEELKNFNRKVTVGSSPVTLDAFTIHQTPGVADHHMNKFGMEYEKQPNYKNP